MKLITTHTTEMSLAVVKKKTVGSLNLPGDSDMFDRHRADQEGRVSSGES